MVAGWAWVRVARSYLKDFSVTVTVTVPACRALSFRVTWWRSPRLPNGTCTGWLSLLFKIMSSCPSQPASGSALSIKTQLISTSLAMALLTVYVHATECARECLRFTRTSDIRPGTLNILYWAHSFRNGTSSQACTRYAFLCVYYRYMT